jgi:hypothetical protein
MKKLIFWTALVLLLELTTSLTAAGQKTYALAFGGGVAIPVGKLSSTQNTGYNGLVALAMGLSDLPVGIRFDGIYNSLLRPATGSGSTSDLRVGGVSANLIYAFAGTSAKAYAIAGVGWYNSKSDAPGTKSQNDWGANGGLGVTFGIGPIATFVESRYHSVSRSESKGGVYQFVPITVGLMF